MTHLTAAIIAGSQNPDSQTLKVAKAVKRRLAADARYSTVNLVDLAATPLPLLGAPTDDIEAERVDSIRTALANADALVIMSPEWHGMATAAVKNFFLHYSRGELAHKPALLISVSASVGGAYPIAELRASSYKNSRICYLPEHLIVRNVNSIFNDDTDNDADAQTYMSARLDYCLALLAAYANAFRSLRDELPAVGDFANGM